MLSPTQLESPRRRALPPAVGSYSGVRQARSLPRARSERSPTNVEDMASHDVTWPIEPHTIAKHEILRGYIAAWYPVLGHTAQGFGDRIAIVDGFCGPGEYTGGEPGSPIIIYDTIRSHKAFPSITTPVQLYFLDNDASRIEHLDGLLKAREPHPPTLQIHTQVTDFTSAFEPLLDDIDSNGHGLIATFAFLDPFGYKDYSAEVASRIAGYTRCEILVYLPIGHMSRFIGIPEQERVLRYVYGDDGWRAAQPLQGQDRTSALRDLFVERLRGSNPDRHVRFFEIVPSSGRNAYFLFFATSSRKGLALMKRAMWRVDPTGSYRFTGRGDGQEVLFGPEPQYAILEKQLRAWAGNRWIPIAEAEDFVLVNTDFCPSPHLRPILKSLERKGAIEIRGDRKKALSYPAGTDIRFA
jgi:three-Cys-motif partner protein